MLLKRIMLGALGCSFGLMTAGGVFTVLLAVGLIPRFAGKTHTANRVMLYETMVILGTLTGDLLSVFEPYTHLGTLAMGAGVTGGNLAERILDVFLSTDFEGGRHQRRIDKMMEAEQ